MPKRQIFINAAMSVAQVVVLGVVLFILYRYLLLTIGVEQLGIWSLVLAATSVTRLSALGLSASVVRFVAKYVSRREEEKVAGVIETAALSVAALVGIALLVAYPFAGWLLTRIVPSTAVELALSVLPYAAMSLWIAVVTGVFQAGLDGYQRIDLRSMLLMGGGGLHLSLVFLLVPAYGLMGLAYAQVWLSVALLGGSWFLLRRQLPILSFVPRRWSRDLFREMAGYGLNFQIVTLATMLYDPITKSFLTAFGGLAMVGYYEMASRMVMQLRALITSANQVVVPVVANLQESRPEATQNVYRDCYSLLTYVALPVYCGMIACTPLVSEFWIGRYEGVFVLCASVLAVGWFLNLFNAPAYYVNLGSGHVGWNLVAHIAIGVMNGGLGFLLGTLYGGWGVILAWVFSLSVGSNFITVAYHLRHKIPLRELFPRQSGMLALASSVGLACSLLVYYQLRASLGLMALGSLVVVGFSAIVALPLWGHPMRKRLLEWATQAFLSPREAV